MSKYWFRPKKFGWGLTPISLEGWLITIILGVSLIGIAWFDNIFRLNYMNNIQAYKTIAIFVFDSLVISLVVICLIQKRVKGW